MPKRDPILDLLDEKDKIIERQSKIIYEADKMYRASQRIPTAGFQPNRDLAEAAKQYKIAKDAARGEQESR